MSEVVFLPKVIKYDRFQPEFYEDTKTYISKRTSKQKIKQGLNLHSKNIDFMYIRKLKNINFLALISLLLNTCHGINTSTWIYARRDK